MREFFLIRPLPRILEFRDIERLVVRRVHVVASGKQAGIHQIEVLVGEGDVDEQLGAGLANQCGGFLGVIGVHLGGGDHATGAHFDFGGDRVTLRERSRGEGDFPEHLGNHGTFVGDDAADSAGSDDEDFVHGEEKRKGWEKCGHWQEILPIRLEMA